MGDGLGLIFSGDIILGQYLALLHATRLLIRQAANIPLISESHNHHYGKLGAPII